MNRGYCGIGLDNPKCANNIGAALRAVSVYGAAFLAVSGRRFRPGPTDTTKGYRHRPLLRPSDIFETLPFDCIPVAVDLVPDAKPLHRYTHPERAYYIFGAEDNTLDARVLDRCRDVIYIPTSHCMNLAATVNVVLYSRACQLGFPEK